MKQIIINFREPNVDRFVEIIALAQAHGVIFSYFLPNMPKGYSYFLNYLDINNRRTDTIEKADFHCAFPERVSLGKLFEKPEDQFIICERIAQTKQVSNSVLDHDAKELLKNAVNRLSLSRDDVQNAITLASFIGAMDNQTIQAHHMAEAIHYLPQTYEHIN